MSFMLTKKVNKLEKENELLKIRVDVLENRLSIYELKK